MSAPQPELMACPFCGGEESRPYVQQSPERAVRWQFRIICPCCNTAGPCKPTEAEAITAWEAKP